MATIPRVATAMPPLGITTSSPNSESYVSIFLQPGWAQEAYQGWSVLATEPGRIKILRKRYGPIVHNLIMARILPEEIERIVLDSHLLRLNAITTLHDFISAALEPRVIAGKLFRPLEGPGRSLNIATFVVDLLWEQEKLWTNLGPKGRNMVRMASKIGVVASVDYPGEADLKEFLTLFLLNARSKNLRVPSLAVLRKMSSAQQLLSTTCRDSSGRIVLINLVYVAGAWSYYMYGANAQEIPTGTGQLSQWETIRSLKGRGLRWYDLGGVTSTEQSNGIYQFKKSIGGNFVDLGREYRYSPRGLRLAYNCYRGFRGMIDRIP